ncbi:MAG: PorP/SprF family type IX secretion system membrane protein [Bacteroidetes bacterium]|nr:PorP/SprF family type IX secretion system membrane protein [Bacteroidota bacterium]
MKNLKYILAVLISGLSTTTLFAQEDYHLSQSDAAALYLNPALTGMFCGEKGDYRIVSDYRSQWHALGIKPYSTAFLSYDMPLRKGNNKWGVGGYLIDNKSGAGKFNTMNFMGSGAYNIMDGTDKHYLTVGLQMGILYKTFDPSSYTYDVQYSSATGTFDTGINNEENFSRTSLVKFDANLGVFYKYIDSQKKYHPYGGFSIYHVTKPNDAFTDYKSRLPMRFILNTGCDITIDDQFSLRPHFTYMNQAKAYEANVGCLVFYKIKNSSLDALAGIDYRWKDAIVAHVGFRQNQHYFRFSYDINTSSLNNFTGGKGAWEFSLILVGFRDKPLFQPLF